MIKITALPGREIALGHRGENLARCVEFPILAEWKRIYGEGSIYLLHQRKGDAAPYPCVLVEEEGCVLWPVTESDVYIPGRGSAELQYFVGETCVKSEVYPTRAVSSLGEAGPVPPNPAQSWVEQVLDAAARAEAAAERAEYAAGLNRDGMDDIVAAVLAALPIYDGGITGATTELNAAGGITYIITSSVYEVSENEQAGSTYEVEG